MIPRVPDCVESWRTGEAATGEAMHPPLIVELYFALIKC